MTRTSRDETFCGICGHLLTRAMIAADKHDQAVKEQYDNCLDLSEAEGRLMVLQAVNPGRRRQMDEGQSTLQEGT